MGGDFNEYDTYFDDDEGLGPNGEDLSELLFDAEKSPDQIWYAPSYDNLENIDLGCDFVTDWNYERFAVLLEKNDEVEGELKDQEKEEKLGLLQEELSKNNPSWDDIKPPSKESKKTSPSLRKAVWLKKSLTRKPPKSLPTQNKSNN